MLEVEEGQFMIGRTVASQGLTPAANQNFTKQLSSPSLENDTAKNAAADECLKSMVAGHLPPEGVLLKAGKAIANRFCFAVDMQYQEENGLVMAMITPVSFFEKNGYCDDWTPPIGHLLPGCAETGDSTWELPETIQTGIDAADYLEKLGFQWNKAFQDRVDPSLTKELEAQEKKQILAAAEEKFSPALKRNISALRPLHLPTKKSGP